MSIFIVSKAPSEQTPVCNETRIIAGTEAQATNSPNSSDMYLQSTCLVSLVGKLTLLMSVRCKRRETNIYIYIKVIGCSLTSTLHGVYAIYISYSKVELFLCYPLCTRGYLCLGLIIIVNNIMHPQFELALQANDTFQNE